METQVEVWTEDDLKHLLNRIKMSIPASEKDKVYSRTQKTMDWKKIAFSKFSSEECHAKWKQMFDKMRKLRTMTDLVEEAECAISDPFKSRTKKIHPEVPSRPAIPHSLYIKENKDAFRKKNPHLKPQQLLALVSSSYKGLPAHLKAEYVEKYKLSRHLYDEHLRELRQQYGKTALRSGKRGQVSMLKRRWAEPDDPDDETPAQPRSSPRRKRQCEVELPDHPPLNGFMLFVKEQRAGSEPLALKDHCKSWRSMKKAEKDGFNRRATELKRQYGEQLKAILSSLTQEQKEMIRDDLELLYRKAKIYSKVPALIFPGEPKQPSWTGASVFCSEQMRTRGDSQQSRQKFASISSRWAALSAEEQAPFLKKARTKFHRYTLDLQEWFNTLSPENQADFRNRKPRQAKYLSTEKLKQPVEQRRMASDTEDEEFPDEIHLEDDSYEEEEEEGEQENDGVLWTHELFSGKSRDNLSSDSDTD